MVGPKAEITTNGKTYQMCSMSVREFMGDALKGYTYSENEDVNAISYTKGSVSYTFRFDEDDILEAGIARNSV